MKIAVFGASGGTGQQIVKQALEKGLQIKALVRDPRKMTISDPKLEIVQGDILNAKSVDKAVLDVDACLLALGAQTPILAEGTKNIINTMKKHGVKRIIVQSSYPMNGAPAGISWLKEKGVTDDQLAGFKHIFDDKTEQEKLTRESGLDYVIVLPVTLTDGEKAGKYRVGEGLNVRPGDTISRADVADFMLKCVTDNQWLSKIVVISY